MSAKRTGTSDLGVLNAFEIRSRLNRELLLQKSAVVEEWVLDEPADLELLDHCWQHVDGRPAGWDWRGARPVGVMEAAATPSLISSRRARRAKALARRLKTRRHYGDRPAVPVQFTILTYAGSRGRRVIIDGNNRAAAAGLLTELYPIIRVGAGALLAFEGHPFRIIEKRIKGPVTGKALPDLYHYTKRGVPQCLLLDPPAPRRGKR